MQVGKANPVTGSKEQFRCSECHNLRARIARLQNQNEHVKEMRHLNAEGRKQCMDDAKGLCGEDLAKMCMESILWSSHYRQSALSQQKGDYEDWDDVRDRYMQQPEGEKL